MLEVLNSLRQHAVHRADDQAIIEGAVSVTYGDLSDRVGGLARRLDKLPNVIGILAPDCLEWIVAYLALADAGKVIVPLPHFFSPGQLSHIVADAGIGHILTTPETLNMASRLNVPHSAIGNQRAMLGEVGRAGETKLIIYTSGTTGQPKGVRLGCRQIDAVARSLASAVAATGDDCYLSLLPFSLLLEQIAAIAVPVLSGARVCIARDAATALNGDPSVLIEAVGRFRPTFSVLVPDLLAIWIEGIKSTGRRPPDCLRFVAVGGAQVAADMAEQGWQLGIPVHEGYGLSECCSVVAVNRLSSRKPGSVGTAIEGVEISIEEGEIVISGPTVMDGYLHQADIDGVWHTGDMGKWDENGNLVVLGRKDNIIVTPNGRNISPEWIEGMIEKSPMIDNCMLGMGEDSCLSAILVPSGAGEQWFRRADNREVADLLLSLCREAPEYARPIDHSVIWPDQRGVDAT